MFSNFSRSLIEGFLLEQIIYTRMNVVYVEYNILKYFIIKKNIKLLF